MSKREYWLFRKIEKVIYASFVVLLFGSIGFIAHQLCMLQSQGFFN